MTAERRACGLCGSEARRVCTQRLLEQHDVDYFLCSVCELLQTEQPYWLEQAYTEAISQLDTGAVQRNQSAARITELLAAIVDIAPTSTCLDYGGGHGVFVRMMRDTGFDFRWFDTYAENLYAGGFEGEPSAHHALVTAFEVLEHFADVRADIDSLFAGRPDHVLVGTVLHRGHQPGWWYYLLESGQHVAFYSPRTLEWIAERFGYDVCIGNEYSLFTKRRLGGVRRLVVQQLLRRPHAVTELVALVPRPVLLRLSPYRSRIQTDHEAMRRRRRA
jgi:hypothetical protein